MFGSRIIAFNYLLKKVLEKRTDCPILQNNLKLMSSLIHEIVFCPVNVNL